MNPGNRVLQWVKAQNRMDVAELVRARSRKAHLWLRAGGRIVSDQELAQVRAVLGVAAAHIEKGQDIEAAFVAAAADHAPTDCRTALCNRVRDVAYSELVACLTRARRLRGGMEVF